MQSCDAAQLDALDRHRLDLLIAVGFKQRLGVGAIRLLVPASVGAHQVSGQQHHLVTELFQLTGPEVRRTARLEQDTRRLALGEETQKLRAR